MCMTEFCGSSDYCNKCINNPNKEDYKRKGKTMARNNLSDLNNHLFEMLEKLGDDEEMQDKEKAEKLIAQSKAMCQVSSQILNIARVQVQALRTAENCGLLNSDMPALIATKDSRAAKMESKKLLEASL